MLFRLGLIINPLAGIGGTVALKGSDGEETVKQAQQLGAVSQAQARTHIALEQIISFKDQLTIYTAANEMGENLCLDMGFNIEVLASNEIEHTSAKDTESTVDALINKGIDLLMFAGGDGTARNIHHSLHQLKKDTMIPVIGIPAGCKIHSAVYAVTPKHAGELLSLIIKGRPLAVKETAVMDIDEDAFRKDIVKAHLYGHLTAPAENQYMQNMKEGGVEHESLVLQDIATYICEELEPDTVYLIGSGTTPKAILDELGLESTLLGIDAIENQQLIEADLDEQKILSYLQQSKPVKIVLTIIGGQGHLFGRGNQQFSPEVIRKIGKENIIVISTPEKLHALNGAPIRIDTGDEGLNEELAGMIQIVTGYDEQTFYRAG
jgi:predicted polyphosphate/ATP-dependent NAD kinase